MIARNWITAMRTSSFSIACMAVVAACNISPVPIAPLAEAPFDSALIGVWKEREPHPSRDTMTMTVLEYRLPEYYIEVMVEDSILEIARARGFITRIGAVTFMNADELTSNPRGYTFYRYWIAGDTLTVRGLSEASQGFTSSGELRVFLLSNLNSNSVYDDSVRFVRVKN